MCIYYVSVLGIRNAEFIGSVSSFARRESGKPFRENPHQYTQLEFNPEIPVIGSQVYCESDALDHVATKTAPCKIWERGPPYCDCDGCDRMSKRGLRMRAGWRHDWNSTDNEFAKVIIPGPFCEPALVTSSPFVFLSTDHRERRRDDCSRYFPAHQRRCAILRSGIPDPWAEYLTLRGVPQVCRRANPEEVHLWRDHLDHVESLWGRLGLSLAQGIPDPWKNWPKCCSSQKRRPDACQRQKTRIPRTCRNRSNSCDSFLTQREAELQFYNCGDPKDMRAISDSVLICKPRNKNEWHGPTFNTEERKFPSNTINKCQHKRICCRGSFENAQDCKMIVSVRNKRYHSANNDLNKKITNHTCPFCIDNKFKYRFLNCSATNRYTCQCSKNTEIQYRSNPCLFGNRCRPNPNEFYFAKNSTIKENQGGNMVKPYKAHHCRISPLDEHRFAEERFLHKEVEKYEHRGNRIRPFIKGRKKPIKRDLNCCCNVPNHVHTSNSCCCRLHKRNHPRQIKKDRYFSTKIAPKISRSHASLYNTKVPECYTRTCVETTRHSKFPTSDQKVFSYKNKHPHQHSNKTCEMTIHPVHSHCECFHQLCHDQRKVRFKEIDVHEQKAPHRLILKKNTDKKKSRRSRNLNSGSEADLSTWESYDDLVTSGTFKNLPKEKAIIIQ